MKKFISFALIAAMAVTTLVGCGNKGAKADGGSSDAAITVMSREDGSGTRGAFIELFGIEEEENGEKVDKTTDEASITNSTSVMMSSVANDANAIGYISLGSLITSFLFAPLKAFLLAVLLVSKTVLRFTVFNDRHLKKALLLMLFTFAPTVTDCNFLFCLNAFAAIVVTL